VRTRKINSWDPKYKEEWRKTYGIFWGLSRSDSRPAERHELKVLDDSITNVKSGSVKAQSFKHVFKANEKISEAFRLVSLRSPFSKFPLEEVLPWPAFEQFGAGGGFDPEQLVTGLRSIPRAEAQRRRVNW
jgi:hypothetical protein